MNGRQETNLKYKNLTTKKFQDLPQFVSDYYYSMPDKADSTKLIYINKVSLFVKYIMESINNITKDPFTWSNLKLSDVSKYLEKIQYKSNGNEISTNTKCVTIFAIKNFLEYMENEEYITKTISSKIKTPPIRQDKEIIRLGSDDISKLLKYVLDNGNQYWKYRDIAIMCLGFLTGMRITSICEINIDDIDFQKQTIQVVEKGNKERTIFINRTTTQFLQQWCEKRNELLVGYDDTDIVFFGKKRKRLNNCSCNEILARYTKEVFGRAYSPHKMRSSFATNLYEVTGDLFLVQKQLGHANPKTTMRYTLVSEEKMKHATEIMDNLVRI